MSPSAEYFPGLKALCIPSVPARVGDGRTQDEGSGVVWITVTAMDGNKTVPGQ